MDFAQIIQDHDMSDFPVGLGGCHASGINFEPCGFDLVVFDEKSESSQVIEHEGRSVAIHHASLSETDSKLLLQYDQLCIIRDDSWELRMMLSKIKEKRSHLFSDFAKNCLIESMFCCQKAKDGVESSDIFAPCWQKCASFYLADAISALNHRRSSPSHMIDALRRVEKSPINDHVATASQSIGIERATPTLLERMAKSTIGFSDAVGGNCTSKLILPKHSFFVANSMLADCYFYLGYVNRDSFMRIRDVLNRRQDLFHMIKVAFDVEADSNEILRQSDLVMGSSASILESVSSTRHSIPLH